MNISELVELAVMSPVLAKLVSRVAIPTAREFPADSQFPADLVTFTEDILNGKLHFFLQCPKGLPVEQ